MIVSSPASARRVIRCHSDYNMYILALQNAKERIADDWIMLFKEVDPKFNRISVYQPPKSSLAIVEVTWEGCGTQNRDQS